MTPGSPLDELFSELQRSAHVGYRTNWCRAARGDDVWSLMTLLELASQALEQCSACCTLSDKMHLSTKEMVKQQVSLQRRIRFQAIQNQETSQASPCRSRSSLPTVVRLCWPLSQDDSCSTGSCIADEVLQLPCLVPAERESCEVVTFDKDTHIPEDSAQAWCFLERRGKLSERETWQCSKTHPFTSSFW